MIVGIYVLNKFYNKIKLESSIFSNPGIGGSEYEALALGFYLTSYYKNINIIFFTEKALDIIDKPNISNILVDNVKDALQKAHANQVDVFIMNKHANSGVCDISELTDLIDNLRIKTITIGQCFYSLKECDYISSSKYIMLNAFVTKQQSYFYLDHNIFKKSIFLNNFTNKTPFENKRMIIHNSKKIVTYVGSLVYEKGFHILAKEWKKISQAVPNAELHVLGSGKLYSTNAVLGKHQIADQNYENLFIPYLTENNQLMSNVFFHGTVNASQMMSVFQETSVGVVNPSGLTETFCISAIEFQINGIPVVSRRYGGLLDTIADGKTGYLVSSDKELRKKIIKLLLNDDKNKEMGKNAITFVNNNFTPDIVIPKWFEALQWVSQNPPSTIYQKRPLGKLQKKLKLILTNCPNLYSVENYYMKSNNYYFKEKRSFYSYLNTFIHHVYNKLFKH